MGAEVECVAGRAGAGLPVAIAGPAASVVAMVIADLAMEVLGPMAPRPAHVPMRRRPTSPPVATVAPADQAAIVVAAGLPVAIAAGADAAVAWAA